MSIGAVGFTKMEIVEASLDVGEGEVTVSYSQNSKSFELGGKFYNGYIINLRYVYLTTNTDIFYKSQYITVNSNNKEYGICKVSFEAEGDLIILGTNENLLPYKDGKVYNKLHYN
jgi:hypothetical protein